jgi:hypothetical protein
MTTTARCASCEAAITFGLIKRRDGGVGRMPLNLKPDMAGNIAATKDVHGTIHGRILTGDHGTEVGETRYQTHFATCTGAAAHRKRDQPATADPETLLKIARREHSEVQRLATRHHATCTARGCGECKRFGDHVARTERQIALLTPAVEAPQESLF